MISSAPEGEMANYIEELVLVKDIRILEESNGQASDQKVSSALTNFSSYESINLLGYVIHSLPSLQAK